MSAWTRATPGVSLFMLDRLSAGVCVLSVASRPHWRGLRRFFRALSEQREGAGRQRTTPSEPRADRGSDSTFQMADIARRILARGSTSPPVCKTADCFLFSPFLSHGPLPCPSSSLSPCLFPQIPNIKTQISTRRWAAGLIPQFLSCVFIILNLHTFPVHTFVTSLFFLFVTLPLTSLPLLLTPSLSAKKKQPPYGYDHPSLSYFLLYREHRPLSSPPTSLLLH